MFDTLKPKDTAKTVEKKEKSDIFALDSKEKLEAKDKKEKSFWFRVGFSFSKYLTNRFIGSGRLEYAKPLSSLERRETEIENNRQNTKILNEQDGGPSQAKIYAAAMKLAKQFKDQESKFRSGASDPAKEKDVQKTAHDEERSKYQVGPDPAKEKPIPDTAPVQKAESSRTVGGKEESNESSRGKGIPLFLSRKIESEMRLAGITEEEINKLPPEKLWDLFEQKNLEKKLKESPEPKIYKIEEVFEEFSILQKTWDDAYDRLSDTNNARALEIIDLTAGDDVKVLEEYLQNTFDLKPEEKFFIEMSIQVKKFGSKGKELLGEDKEISLAV